MPYHRPLNWYEPIQFKRTFKVGSVNRLCLQKVTKTMNVVVLHTILAILGQ